MAFLLGRCRLAYWMRIKKLSPTELADKVEMSVQEVSDHAHDRKKMTLPTAKAYSVALDVPIEELYEWKYTPSRKSRRQSQSE